MVDVVDVVDVVADVVVVGAGVPWPIAVVDREGEGEVEDDE